MRYRFAVLVPVVLVALFTALPAVAAPGSSQASPAVCAKAAPAAASFTTAGFVAAPADKHTYCYDSRNACDNAQRAASGTKSSCYKSGTQYCYDLFTAAAGDPEPVDP
jgi:hypothetical protein